MVIAWWSSRLKSSRAISCCSNGDLIAADARLIQASILRFNEAPLTGELKAVGKFTGGLLLESPLAERNNMFFLSTSVTGGSGRAFVVNTGMEAELGHIAKLLETAESGEIPPQQNSIG